MRKYTPLAVVIGLACIVSLVGCGPAAEMQQRAEGLDAILTTLNEHGVTGRMRARIGEPAELYMKNALGADPGIDIELDVDLDPRNGTNSGK